MAGMYSLNDITNDCPIKVETTLSSCNGQSSEINSTGGMPVLKTETSETSCNTVDHHTISLPQESIYEVALNTEDDVLKIQISNVQGATSDQNAVKVDLTTFNPDQLENHAVKDKLFTVNHMANHTDKLGMRSQELQSRFEAEHQTKIPFVAESFPGGQLSKSITVPAKMYPVETEMHSPVNHSSIPNEEPLTKTEEQQKELPFQFNSHEPEIVPSYHLSDQPDISQMSPQYPSAVYQTNSTMSASQGDTQGTLSSYQNGSAEIVSSYQISTNMTLPSVYTSTPLHHMATQGEMPGSQPKNFGINASVFQMNNHTEIPVYYAGYNSHKSQLTKLFSQSLGVIPNQQKSAQCCSCCCHAQNESSHYPAFGLEAPRPSVIMVPVNRINTSPGASHIPFKVDPSPYTLPSEHVDFTRQDFTNRMDCSDDSDSSDDDDENGKPKKYFRKNIDGTTARFKLTKEDWARIPINTFPSGGRLLSGDWTRIFLSKVKESNPWCSLRFKNNHVRSENSRKIHSAVFFRGGAECKRPECNVKVRFVIRKEKGKHVDVTYVGDVCHDSQPGRSDVIDDRKRKKVVRRTCSS